MLLWKMCSCNLRGLGWIVIWKLCLPFSLCFYVYVPAYVCLLFCVCDPMLSMCARGSRQCRFVLMRPDRSPVRRGQRAALLLGADAIIHHKAQHQQSRDSNQER